MNQLSENCQEVCSSKGDLFRFACRCNYEAEQKNGNSHEKQFNIGRIQKAFPSEKEAQEIKEQLKIIEHHPIVGLPDSLLGYVFEKVYNCCEGSFYITCSMIYTLGKIAGIRQERSRKKGGGMHDRT